MTTRRLDLELKVCRAEEIADGIHLFELKRNDGAPLPAFTPGAHIHVAVTGDENRQYSLCNDPADNCRYLIAVKREPDGRGGSLALTRSVRTGDMVRVSEPANDFALEPNPNGYVFIAGGIGITPILSMARYLSRRGEAPFTLYYLTRNRQMTAFADDLAASDFADQVVLHHDHGRMEDAFDLRAALATAAGRDIYCCGPRPLLDAVHEIAAEVGIAKVHFEDFGGIKATQSDGDGAFRVRLARSGETVEVPAGTTILEALRAAGHDLPSSCEAGTCGTCRTGLLSGAADHRDLVLFEDEMDDNIMICCSRAKSEELVLDL